MTAFFDAFAFIAWANPSDPAHGEVGQWLSGYRGRFLTTEWISMEFADALSSRNKRATAIGMIDHHFEQAGFRAAFRE